ncbi:Glucose dehydrogenase [FAD, quinone] [Lamellibrachia satsuma]|nr:Glucose dehydrogenase [FAD, quinone] [Lamellibrachia satsuma]
MIGQYLPTIVAVGAILATYKLISFCEVIDNITAKPLEDKYDYVIVGGGTSGAVLARRLAEDSDTTVLLLEAGVNPTGQEDVDVPLFADKLIGSHMDWRYTTTKQKHACKGHKDGVSVWPSGKGLGGSSNINYMQYLRGNRHDYDDWANNGAQGWSYKEVLPYFIKSEDNHNSVFTRTVFHGYGGKMTISDIRLSPVNEIAEKALKELGVPKRDTNGKTQFGYGHTQATIRDGMRWTTFKAFLKRALHWPNLYVMTDALVQKVMFDGRRAAGVLYKRGGEERMVKAKKEVILCAGTVGSAKLLLLSGVGPRNHLLKMKIPVISDVPVGENLQDHVMSNGIEFYSPHTMTITPAKAENLISSWAYSMFGTGLKMSPRYREGTAYVKTRHQPPHMKYPLIALHFVANIDIFEPEQLNVKDSIWSGVHGKPPHTEGFTVFPILLHPRSRGTIRLKSSDPEDDVLINPNYFSETSDIKILVEATQYARRLVKTKTFKDWQVVVDNSVLPECAQMGNFTDLYHECYIRHITLSGQSPVGTCKMGALGDPTAVVDPLLRVRGVKGLRVVDASVVPSAMSGNSYTTQVMIAEKAADIIRGIDSVKPIKDYFRHMIAIKHSKVAEDENAPSTATAFDDDEEQKAKTSKNNRAKKAAKRR